MGLLLKSLFLSHFWKFDLGQQDSVDGMAFFSMIGPEKKVWLAKKKNMAGPENK